MYFNIRFIKIICHKVKRLNNNAWVNYYKRYELLHSHTKTECHRAFHLALNTENKTNTEIKKHRLTNITALTEKQKMLL